MAFEQKVLKHSNRKPNILGQDEFFKSAVLVPIIDYMGQECLLFEKRSGSLNKQPGEICFPGGSIESDDANEASAAIRETCEELGILSQQIEVIAPLDVFVSPFNMIVYPFASIIRTADPLTPNPDEVESLLFIPIQDLINIIPLQKHLGLRPVIPEGYPVDLVPNGSKYPLRDGYYKQLFYVWQDQVIWGMTARILEHFLKLVKDI